MDQWWAFYCTILEVPPPLKQRESPCVLRGTDGCRDLPSADLASSELWIKKVWKSRLSSDEGSGTNIPTASSTVEAIGRAFQGLSELRWWERERAGLFRRQHEEAVFHTRNIRVPRSRLEIPARRALHRKLDYTWHRAFFPAPKRPRYPQGTWEISRRSSASGGMAVIAASGMVMEDERGGQLQSQAVEWCDSDKRQRCPVGRFHTDCVCPIVAMLSVCSLLALASHAQLLSVVVLCSLYITHLWSSSGLTFLGALRPTSKPSPLASRLPS